MIATVNDFVAQVKTLKRVSDAYDVFEYDCTDAVRASIYALADKDSNEPFRDAMHTLGFKRY